MLQMSQDFNVSFEQRCWDDIRKGLFSCLEDDENRKRCIRFCENTGSPQRKIWQELLEGRYPERVIQIVNTKKFSELSKEDALFWETHIQNHPFAVLEAG